MSEIRKIDKEMIRYTQTSFGNGADGSTPGNCFQTAVASLLSLPLEDVPHFTAGEDWWGEFCSWVKMRNLSLTWFDEQFETQDIRNEWLTFSPLHLVPLDKILIASGISSRNLRHCVLWEDGKLLHDPHPSHDGLVNSPDSYFLLEEKTISCAGR